MEIIVVGEILVDLIGHEIREEIFRTHSFRRFQGGSPANLAANLCRLGKKVHLVASVGNDGLGQYLVKELESLKLDTTGIHFRATAPTSLVLLSRSHGTPDFIAYREADRLIYPEDITSDHLRKAKIYHTTCFALSKQPAQHAILNGAKRARDFDVQLSIDLNYAPAIWPDHEEALQVIKEYCLLNPLVKVSRDDCERIFEKKISEENAIQQILGWGAKLVCFTKGKEGSHLVAASGENILLSAASIPILGDATGAGDAFWSGFLAAYLDGKNYQIALEDASKMAALKLSTDGPLPEKIKLEET